MPAGSSPLTVLLAATGPQARAVRDVLRDWSAAGLLHDLIWIWDVDAQAATGTAIATTPAESIIDGAVSRTRLQDHLADHGENRPLRLCVVSSLGGESSTASAEAAARLRHWLVSGPLPVEASIHCLLTRHGQGGWDDAAVWEQWHNVVLAPEDSSYPGAQPVRQVFAAEPDRYDGDFPGHSAAGLAGVAGLWRGMDRTGFDRHPLPGGPMLVVARCHLRKLNTDAVTEELRTGFAELKGEFPRPVVNGRALDYLEDPAEATAQVVDQVLDRHPELFRPVRESAQERPAIRVRWWQMLGWFFSFVWAALRSAPAEWLETVSDKAASQVAKVVHQVALGGQESRYKVIVRGVGADGLKDDTLRLAEAAESLFVSVRRFSREESALPSLAGFWRDVHAGAFTLVDGVEHVPGMLGPTVGGRPGLVRRPAMIAPANDHRFEVDQLLATRTVSAVEPYDVRTARLLDQALDSAIAGQGLEVRTSASQQVALRHWFEGLSTAYTVRIGRKIDERLHQSLTEVLDLLARLREAGPDEPAQDEAHGGAGLLARKIRRRVLTAAGVALVSVLLSGRGWISWRVGLTVAVLAILTGLLSAAVIFIRSAQAEFARACAARPDDSESQLLVRNLVLAAKDVQLLSLAYAQYLCWAPVLSRFVAEPLAHRPLAEVPSCRLVGVLPRGIRLGVAVADPEASSLLIDAVRSEVLQPGWLGSLWEQALDRAPGQLGRAGRLLEPEALLKDRTTDSDSPLRTWSALVVEHGTDPAAGEEMWRRARASILGQNSSVMAQRLFSRVEVGDRNARTVTESGERFLTVLLSKLAAPREFDSELFTSLARNERAGQIEQTVVVADPSLLTLAGAPAFDRSVTLIAPEVEDGADLDQFVVVVETSAWLPGHGYLHLSEPHTSPTVPAESAENAESADGAHSADGADRIDGADLHELM